MSVPLSFVLKHHEFDWNWYIISTEFKDSKELLNFVEKFPDKDYNWEFGISLNQHLTREFVEKFCDKNWNWNHLDKRLGISLVEIIKQFPDRDWNWQRLSSNLNISLKLVELFSDKDWYWGDLSKNPKIILDFQQKYPNSNIVYTFFEHHPESGIWQIIDFTKDFNFPLRLVEQFPDKDWDWPRIAEFPTITMEFIENIIEQRVEQYTTTHVEQYTTTQLYASLFNLEQPPPPPPEPNDVQEPVNEPVENHTWKRVWENISKNPNITPKIIEKYPNKPWNWKFISRNPTITPDFIERHLDKKGWDFYQLTIRRTVHDYMYLKDFPCFYNIPVVQKYRKEQIELFLNTIEIPFIDDVKRVIFDYYFVI